MKVSLSLEPTSSPPGCRDSGWGRDRGSNSRDAVACSHNPVSVNEGAAAGVVVAPALLILKGDLVAKKKGA